MIKRMLELIDSPEHQPNIANSPWRLVFADKKIDLSVYWNPQISNYCYKIISTINNTQATTFDLMANINRRPDWDAMIAEARDIEEIDEFTKIQVCDQEYLDGLRTFQMILIPFLKFSMSS